MKNIAQRTVKSLITASAILVASTTAISAKTDIPEEGSGKAVIYQVMTRIFGNDVTTNKSWGTIEENGVGKFADFTPEALSAIKKYGVTHIWYTGVPHHAVIRDYTKYGISLDDPDVVKGRAGSPYAVKDYYNVNPDLATDPAKRLEEFEALIARTHNAGMKVMIDIVPNHVARQYESISRPEGVDNFGAKDDTSVDYHRDNNFYYIVGESFTPPVLPGGLKPLNGESNLLSDGKFDENPAKWTGNGARRAQPKHDDWFETVKINFGVKPDGTYDFDRLPDGYDQLSTKAHFAYWKNRDVPDSWVKFKQIVYYWLDKGVDGFRFDMAEMVPVEFWSYLNSHIKHKNPDATLMAEVYNRDMYRDYIKLGRMDILYDKVDLYDTLKLIMQGKQGATTLLPITEAVSDIEQYMIHFLENHDEYRIASPGFVGDALKGKPAMAVSALLGTGPTLLYYGQALGTEPSVNPGWIDTRQITTIHDYWGVETLKQWRNGGSYDGQGLDMWRQELQKYYQKLLNISANERALAGNYEEIHTINLKLSKDYDDRLFSFVRWQDDELIVVIVNFSEEERVTNINLPRKLIESLKLSSTQGWKELLTDTSVTSKNHQIPAKLSPNGVLILKRELN